jgi:hypothetical protein
MYMTLCDLSFQVLSCIPGHTLFVPHSSGAQWFLQSLDKTTNVHPLDIFVTVHDDRFIWAVAAFTFIKDTAARLDDVIPLARSEFEGKQLPAPGRTSFFLQRLFHPEDCVAQNYKTAANETWSGLIYIKCSELSDVYPIHLPQTETAANT